MPGTQLRRATTADAAEIRALTRAAYSKWVPVVGREPLPMTANYDFAVREHLIAVLEKDGRLLALIEMIPKETHLLIENVAVRPDQQSRGLGDRLLHHAEGIARSLGLLEMRLYTNAAFGANVAFYARRGYQETLREVMVPGSTTVHMMKRLAPAA